MAPLGDGSLTSLGFRRDVKIFLAAMVGYLIVVILALLLILQNSVITTTEVTRASWDLVAEMIVRDLDRLDTVEPAAAQRRLSALRVTAGLLSIELVPHGGAPIRSGFSTDEGQTRSIRTRHGELRLVFDDTIVRQESERFQWIAIIVIAGTLTATLLLVLYLPRIVRPIEEMLAHAREIEDRAAGVDEAQYLVETFRKSIDALREQKDEISRLHEKEKSRADDLERVASTLKRSIASGFIALDHEGRVVDLNAVARDVLGIEPAIGTPVRSALPDGPFASDLSRAVSGKLSLTRHETLHPTSRGDVAIGLTTVPLLDANDAFIGTIAIFTDLTTIRGLEQRVRELQTLADLGEISAGIAHEFRNSLSTILGYLRLSRTEGLPQDVAGRIGAAEHEARLLAEAVSRLLGFAKPFKLDLAPTDLAEVASDVVARLRPEAEDVQIVLRASPAVVRGDASLLRVLVENVVRNAIEAVSRTSGPRRVEVTTERGESCILTVSDNGPGIDEKDIGRIFLPFQSGRPGGFGLGLALSRKIALHHEGDVTLRRRDEGGMTARLVLPPADAGSPD